MANKRKAIYLMVVLILSLGVVQAYGSSIEDLKQEKKNLNQEIKEQQNRIKDIENQSKDVSKEIDDLDRKMDHATVELEKVEDDLQRIGLEIEKTQEELDEAEESLNERQETFNSRLRVMYMNGNVGYLDLLLSSENIKDFLSRKDMVKSITDHDKELIKFMKEQRDIIDEKKIELQAQNASIELAKTKLESRRKDLEIATRSKESLMLRLDEDLETEERLYEEVVAEAKAIESKILKLQRDTGPYSGGVMAWPVPGQNKITSQYGYRLHPVLNTTRLHTGIDIRAPIGTSIVAASDGTVIYSDWLGSYGKAVMIDHGGGIVTLYGHNSSLTVSNGTIVKRGDTIAKAGSTGVSTGPHCHFEVRKNGIYQDPIGWLRGN